MRNYVIKRLLISVVILFFVTLILYFVMRMLPTSYIERVALEKSQQPNSRSYEEWLAQLTAVYGMDKGIIGGFFTWLSRAIRLDFGDSWQYNMPVIDKFKQVIWDSFALSAITLVLQYAIAIPLGILSARKQYSKTDYTITVIALLGISLPSFFIATLLKLVFSVNLGWFDLYGKVGRFFEQLSPFEQFLDVAHHYVLPVITLTLVSVGSLMRYTRTNMLEEMNSDYVRTARAKGLLERKVVNGHAFRNTLIPLVTLFGGTIPTLFSGAMMTEILFQIPGIGYTSYQAIINGDIPFAMFYMTFLAVLTLTGTLISDILYAVVDPRVRIS